MPSPFPGMNPYLERPDMWADFHDQYLVEMRNALSRQVRPNYVVKIEEYVYVQEVGEDDWRLAGRPDVSLLASRPPAGAGGAGVLEAPAAVGIPADVELIGIPYLQIHDRKTREVVTAVELLSPSNKAAGEARAQHVRKWRMILGSPASMVEIDLLRGGRRMAWVDMPECDHCVTVSRPPDRPRAAFWPIRLRDRLPPIPVPLRAGDPEPTLDLQSLLDTVYDAAGYAYHLYEDPPDPPLPPDDAAWAADIVAAATAPA